MKNRPVQYFTKEYLERCKSMTPDQIIEFLENFRELMSFRLEQMNQSVESTQKDPSPNNK